MLACLMIPLATLQEVLTKTTTKIQDSQCFYLSFRLTVLPLSTLDRSRCHRYSCCSLLAGSVSLVLLCLSITSYHFTKTTETNMGFEQGFSLSSVLYNAVLPLFTSYVLSSKTPRKTSVDSPLPCTQ